MANTPHIADPSNGDLALVPVTLLSRPPGWRYTAYPSISDAGITVTKLVIEEDPELRPTRLGITETVLRSISIPTIRSQLVEAVEANRMQLEEALAEVPIDDPGYPTIKRWADQATRISKQSALQRKRRASLKKQSEWAGYAKQVVAAARDAREQHVGIYSILSKQWGSGDESSDHALIKSRLRRLRERRYTLGSGRDTIPGPELEAWIRLEATDQKE